MSICATREARSTVIQQIQTSKGIYALHQAFRVFRHLCFRTFLGQGESTRGYDDEDQIDSEPAQPIILQRVREEGVCHHWSHRPCGEAVVCATPFALPSVRGLSTEGVVYMSTQPG